MTAVDVRKVLLDTSIVSGAELAEPVMSDTAVNWGDVPSTVRVLCFKKKEFDDASYQAEIDALPTIGRLIREKGIAASSYNELRFEAIRHRSLTGEFYALNGCSIDACPAPIERSKFRQTVDFGKHLLKGGKKDRKMGMREHSFSQIAFVEWILSLTGRQIQALLAHSDTIGLTEFERESFHEIDWFRNLCECIGSRENYPDAFHVWTAERNAIGVFLTLEKTLPNIVRQIKSSKKNRHTINTTALRPTEFLEKLGVAELDTPPMESGRIYSFVEAHDRA